MDLQTLVRESRRNFAADEAQLREDHGIVFMDGTRAYLPEPMRKRGGRLSDLDITALNRALVAMDAQPILTTTPNSAIPSLLTTFIDPDNSTSCSRRTRPRASWAPKARASAKRATGPNW